MIGLDKWLTTEPDNNMLWWSEMVWAKIPESKISNNDYDQYEDLLHGIEEYISQSGTLENGQCGIEFTAQTIISTFQHFKQGKITELLQAVFKYNNDLYEKYSHFYSSQTIKKDRQIN